MAKTAKQESEQKKRKERRERTTHRRETVKYSRVAIVPSERHGALGMEYYWNIHMHLLGVYSISLSQVSPARSAPARELEKGDQLGGVVMLS